MAAKKKIGKVSGSVTSNLRRELEAASAEVAKLRTELETVGRYRKWAEDARDGLNRQVEGVHAMLDAIPDALKRKRDEYGQDNEPAVRLAALFAARAFR